MNMILNLWRRWQEPKAWAVFYAIQTHKWVKVVSRRRPVHVLWDLFGPGLDKCVGPFRSEVDCEEFIEKANGSRLSESWSKNETDL